MSEYVCACECLNVFRHFEHKQWVIQVDSLLSFALESKCKSKKVSHIESENGNQNIESSSLVKLG